MSRFVKNPDEIVLENVKMLHYETMEEGRAVWIGIYMNDGKMYHMNIGGDNLYVNYSYEGNDPNITGWAKYTNEEQALNALDKLYQENDKGMEQLAND